MQITYQDTKELQALDLEELFLSVNWSSAQYSEKLKAAMERSDTVFTAWDGDRLIGLINVLDDGVMTAYVHFLLVNPEYQGKGIGKRLLERVKDVYRDYLRILLVSYTDGVEFYKRCGFHPGEGSVPMYLTSLAD